MSTFDEKNASADELWDYCIMEYENQNFIVQQMFQNYFTCIQEIISGFPLDYKLLEVGCGAGVSSKKIFQMLKGQSFEISDFDARYVKKLRENNLPYKVQQESVLELNRDDRSFDCVFLLEVLEHVENYELALANLFRVSRKYVVLSVPNEPLWSYLNMARLKYLKDWGNTPGHINHWSVSGFKKLISKYGSVVSIYTPLPWIIAVAEVRPIDSNGNK